MAISVCKGISGGVTFPAGGGFRAAQWRAEVLTDIHDATGFDSGGVEENETGLERIVASAAGFLTKGTTATGRPPGGSYTFTADEGCTIVCTLRVGRWAPDVNVNDNGKCAMDGRSSGAFTITWDDGA
jgi:hypothetical protein